MTEKIDPEMEKYLVPAIDFLKSIQTSDRYNYSIATDVAEAIKFMENIIKRSKKKEYAKTEVFASDE